MLSQTIISQRRIMWLLSVCLGVGFLSLANAQPEQFVEVTIKDFTFRSTQMPLQLHAATLIHVKNEDSVRHDFGSTIFKNSPTRVETGGVITYGERISGAFLDPGQEVSFRFVIERPGRYTFRCSIHPDMNGEILLLSAGAV